MDGEKLMVSSSNFDDGSMIVSVGTTDFNNYGDSDFMEIMINKDGKIDYFTLPVGKDDYQRMYKIKPSHYGRMKTQNETNESAGGDFIRTDGDGKYAESFGAESYSAEDNIIRFKVGERYTHRYHHGYGFRDNEVMRRTDKTVWTSQVNPETGELDSPLLVSRHKIHTSQPFELDGEIVSSYESYGLGNHAYRVTAGDTSLRTYDAESFGAEEGQFYQLEIKSNMADGWEWVADFTNQQDAINAYYEHYDKHPEVQIVEVDSDGDGEVLLKTRNYNLGAESFGAESKMCSYCKTTDLKNFSQGWDDYCMACARRHHREYGAESFSAYEDPISDRQRYRIRKLGGRIEKSMNRSDASRYIKSLMADPLHAETQALDCSTCQGWGWNEDLNMVCDADGCIGGWVVPKKPSLLERGLELGAGVGMGMASVAIVFGILGGTVGLAAEELKKRRE